MRRQSPQSLRDEYRWLCRTVNPSIDQFYRFVCLRQVMYGLPKGWTIIKRPQ